MRRLLLGLLAALALAAPARAEPPVWVVKDRDSEMVIFGSVHLLPPGLAWRPKRLEAALARADDLWFELPQGAAAQAELARRAADAGALPPGKSLSRLLPAADAARLGRVAEAYGVDKAALDRMEPWLAEIALASAVYRRAGADAGHGVEATLAAAAPRAARRALETPASQIAIFDGSPQAEQIASLRETLREMEDEPKAYEAMVRAWMAGDLQVLQREALAPVRRTAPTLFRRLVTERNAAWTRALSRRLQGKGRTVVVVGVGHLIGPEGLPARLRALGYSVSGP